jgi:hypothetical protein
VRFEVITVEGIKVEAFKDVTVTKVSKNPQDRCKLQGVTYKKTVVLKRKLTAVGQVSIAATWRRPLYLENTNLKGSSEHLQNEAHSAVS